MHDGNAHALQWTKIDHWIGKNTVYLIQLLEFLQGSHTKIVVSISRSYNKFICNGRSAKRLIALLNELDSLVRPWPHGAFEIGVAV